MTFTTQGQQFLLDGQPFQIRSGELHYNRIPREYWRDRIEKAKAMGLNTICTYVFWNEHEARPGQWDFDGRLDVAAFVDLAQELGLWVIVRPGPYVCSEWEWGGFPYWLANVPDILIRQDNPAFLDRTAAYMNEVGRRLADRTVSKGGPILMVQVENEYGSFGSDSVYMGKIRDQVVAAGFDCLLFTSDGPTPEMLAGGTLPDAVSVINFGSRPAERFEAFRTFRPEAPLMCGELWFGWFDHWGSEHHVTDADQQAEDLRWFMENGASFNFYMIHGGTNWGFMNGANWTPDGYRPDVTSYDYDAAIGEDGRLTEKYFRFRDVITEFVGPLPEPPVSRPAVALPEIEFLESCEIKSLAQIGMSGWSSFDELNHGYGFVLYRVGLGEPGEGELELHDLQDYAVVMSGGRIVGTLDRRLAQTKIDVGHPGVIEILVENSGRINYARQMLSERKGIRGATFAGNPVLQVHAHSIDFDKAVFERGVDRDEPSLYRAEFSVQDPADTHLDLRGWGKGNVWVNGFNLGRYRSIGPQRTLYLPGTLLVRGKNEIIVCDLEPGGRRRISGIVDPILG